MATYEFSVAIDGKMSAISLRGLKDLLDTLPDEQTDTPVTNVLSDITQIGTIGLGVDTRPLYGLRYQGYWPVEMPQPDEIVVRGVNVLQRNDVKLNTGVKITDFSGSPTAWNGLSQPKEFPAVVPGYTAGIYAKDQGQYFKRGDSVPSVPDKPATNGTAKPITTMPHPDPDQKRATLNDLQTS